MKKGQQIPSLFDVMGDIKIIVDDFTRNEEGLEELNFSVFTETTSLIYSLFEEILNNSEICLSPQQTKKAVLYPEYSQGFTTNLMSLSWALNQIIFKQLQFINEEDVKYGSFHVTSSRTKKRQILTCYCIRLLVVTRQLLQYCGENSQVAVINKYLDQAINYIK
ncbi:Hypothetical_protein [Hexamita inflata]|uniref:Hypothetical_protein n=1 Tax=Hexamita inflata TaxID=28002 RepID=A0AA86TT56_9EUKA|nr:Hypothetical protein HINF_LOCUS15391 [Hexamita inflata]